MRSDDTVDDGGLLLVCRANLIRSPLAAGLMRRELAQAGRDDLSVSSCGVHVLPHTAPGSAALTVFDELGIVLDGWNPRPVDPRGLASAALVITMTEAQRTYVARLRPGMGGRTFTFRELGRLLEHQGKLGLEDWDDVARRAHVARPLAPAAGAPEDVPDPVGQSLVHHRAVAEELAALCRSLARRLLPRTSPAPSG